MMSNSAFNFNGFCRSCCGCEQLLQLQPLQEANFKYGGFTLLLLPFSSLKNIITVNQENNRLVFLSQRKSKMHYQIAVIINFLGHCISMVALLIAFFLFLCLR